MGAENALLKEIEEKKRAAEEEGEDYGEEWAAGQAPCRVQCRSARRLEPVTLCVVGRHSRQFVSLLVIAPLQNAPSCARWVWVGVRSLWLRSLSARHVTPGPRRTCRETVSIVLGSDRPYTN